MELEDLQLEEGQEDKVFPDNYDFLDGIVQERVQTGNAVRLLLIFVIAKEIRVNYGGKSWKIQIFGTIISL